MSGEEELILYVLGAIVFIIWGLFRFFSISPEEKERIERTKAMQEIASKTEERAKTEMIESQAMQIYPVVTHDIPSNPKLAAYMRDLPQKIQSAADAQRIATKLEHDSKIGLWQNAVLRVLELIRPYEFIYAMTWNAHCISMTRDESQNYTESHGVVFFSNMRFLHYKDPANIIEFPLSDIYTVESHSGSYFEGISFRTPTLHIQLTFAGEIDRKLFRDMIIHIAACAACPTFTNSTLEDETLSQICECSGCGATVIIHANVKTKCDFCGRFAEKRPGKKPSASSADEIKKYKELLESGVISKHEFETAKEKIINRL